MLLFEALRSAPACAYATVTTIAGSGLSGVQDGKADKAQFMMPMGLAVDSKGDVYVADAAAQRIRKVLSSGFVETVAGGGVASVDGLWIDGGYRDGPTSQALFNHPSALAIRVDGTIYVADTLNHCVRKIQDGSVTTFAGQETTPGKADGDPAHATLMFPRSLAFDKAGNLYVADYLAGVREISPFGEVTSIKLPKDFDLHVTSVAVDTNAQELFVANDTDILALDSDRRVVWRQGLQRVFAWRFDLHGKDALSTAASQSREGPAFAILPLGPDSLVYTNIASHTLWYFEHGSSGVVARVLNALPSPDATNTDGGYQDGDLSTARFDVPMGVARLSDGGIAVADAGNRRIRKISSTHGLENEGPGAAPNRRPVPPVDPARDRVVIVGERHIFPALDSRYYRIAFVGNSYTYWNTQWAQSIPGIVEKQLSARWRSIGLPREPRIIAIWPVPTSLLTAVYIREVLSQGVVDAVIWDVNLGQIGPSFPALIDNLRTSNQRLASVNLPLVIVINPYGVELTPLETTEFEEVDEPEAPDWSFLLWRHTDITGRLREAVRSSGVPMIDLYSVFVSAEQAPRRVPLYGTRDWHFSENGRALAAMAIARALEKRRPWQRFGRR